MSTVQEYIDLITTEHSNKPKFVDAVTAITKPLVDLENVITSMPEAYDVDVALGVQLDAVGKWVGASRQVSVPIDGIYFAWDDTADTGWDMGAWKGPFDPDSGLTTLPDVNYRLLIKAKIFANHWDGTIPSAYEIWRVLFGDSLIILIQDNQDMSMSIGFVGVNLDSITRALLVGGYLPLKPAGVKINYYLISDTGPLFCFDANETDALAGWDIGKWATQLTPT